MSCEDCLEYRPNSLYNCSCCRSCICEKCYINNKYLLCKSCNLKFEKGKIGDKDIYSWLITCENCGNMWDGYAQCNCWEFDYSLTFEDDDNMTDKEDE